ncbi:MAG TPA: FAD-dependent oxidoreductase [Cellulomonas sp.]|uniref:NAD(P)/FAD-dependent oxidoreductase n=1 Tax=Cellulomonas sp. TaxID=40001 RepID=UPI002E367874|nr:FAD-dependent oxidoreductase [Cellulomonas sp.]HEX5333814.1 FAD-dependent oxidoreductase [Cellulomonas sp.]
MTIPAQLRSVVVVGAGLAGSRTVVALREQGFDGQVTLLGAEGLAPYDRPPLSKHLFDRPGPAWLADELGDDGVALADDVRLDARAQGLLIGPGSVDVTTADGTITADAAVVASGSHAIRPAGWEAAATLHTAADAAHLRSRLTPGARLVVIGAGWIGAEVAGVAAAAGVTVTVVEALGAPLTPALGSTVGALTVPWYAAAGVELVTGTRVERVRGDGVELAGGRHLEADVVLAAVGARPSTGWLAGSLPLEEDGSVRVDGTFTPLGGPWHVRAVGDVARRASARHGVVAGGHWDGALRGPALAVRSLLTPTNGPGVDDDPAPYVFSTQLGHELAMFGQPDPADDVVLRGEPSTGPSAAAGDGWTALWFSPGTDVLTAVLAVDRPRDVAAARRLFTDPALPRLDRGRAADPTLPLRAAVTG